MPETVIGCGEYLSQSYVRSLNLSAENLNYVVVSREVKVIESDAFKDCLIKSLVFQGDSELICLEEHAFRYSSVESIRIPASCSWIGASAFEAAPLKDVSFEYGSKLERISESAFAKTALEHLVIPASVSSIDRLAFSECSLESITFEPGSRLKRIGFHAFGESKHGHTFQKWVWNQLEVSSSSASKKNLCIQIL